MYEHFLTDEQRILWQTVRKFADNEVAPQAAEVDEEAKFNRPLFNQIAELGFMGIPYPEEYDGIGEGLLSTALVIFELARACGATGMGLAAHYLGADSIFHFGSEDQKQKYMPAVCRGETLCAFALTEPGAGSDVSGIQTSAKLDGDSYVINGSKIFITNGGEAEIYILFARTDPKGGAKGLSAFIVEKGTPGFSFGKKEDKMGMRGSINRELIFDDCRIPAANLLGTEGLGFKIAMTAIDTGRVVTSAYTLGVAQAAMDDALKYSRERVQFGKPICEFQGIQFMLADMRAGIESAKLLIYNAAYKADNGLPFAVDASIAKMVSSDVAMKVSTDAVQIFGGYGYMKEYPAERHMRDAKLTQILEGTNQIMRVVIARDMIKNM